MSPQLAIAAPQRSAAEAGAAAFAAGGNALDAALAAAASLTVSYPDNCALGGDLIALVRAPDGTATVVNASGPAPAAVQVDAAEMPLYGPATVTVPGLVAGWDALWSLGAARPWADVFAAAIAQAEDGVTVPPSLAASFAEEARRLTADPGLSTLFLREGAPLHAGDRLRQPALAATLRRLAADGADALYRGPIGASLVRCLQGHGSAMTEADLAGYAPELDAPLRERIGDREILTAPPNSQGFLLPRILQAAGDRDPLGAEAGELAAIFADAAGARTRELGDPRTRRATGDTVAVVAADSDGYAVSLIQSLFHAFGSGIADPETGIVLHNRGASFSLDRASPNVLAGGKRPAHTLMPAAVLEHDRLTTVLGTMGGSAQPQILAQVLSRLARGETPQRALDAPRWILADDGLHAERSLPAAARAALARTGTTVHELPDLDAEVGHTQLVTIAPDGALTAASDPRSEGGSLVVRR